MKTYEIYPLSAPLPWLAGRVFDPDTEPFCARPYAAIDSYVWPGDYKPEARAYVAWDPEGLYVLLCAREAETVAEARAFNGEVYRDSCLECFFRPEDAADYMNIEVNAAGAALIGFGPDRERRERLTACPPGMDIQAARHAGAWWAVAYRVPAALMMARFGRPLSAGMGLRGNFYCCDETLHPHFGSWNPIASPAPDFHRPECFGQLILSE